MADKTIKSEVKKDERVRTFATIIYPESAPDNWKDILSDLHTPVFISPLHDQDVNPTGEPKKPHYHVVLNFENKKTDEQVRKCLLGTGSVGLEHVSNLRGYSRYLCHLDNPEKAQYKVDDVIALSGADYLFTIGLPSDKYKIISEMQEWVEDNDIEALCDLMDYSRQFKRDWFVALCDTSAYVMGEYLRSRTWKKERDRQKEEAERLSAAKQKSV